MTDSFEHREIVENPFFDKNRRNRERNGGRLVDVKLSLEEIECIKGLIQWHNKYFHLLAWMDTELTYAEKPEQCVSKSYAGIDVS